MTTPALSSTILPCLTENPLKCEHHQTAIPLPPPHKSYSRWFRLHLFFHLWFCITVIFFSDAFLKEKIKAFVTEGPSLKTIQAFLLRLFFFSYIEPAATHPCYPSTVQPETRPTRMHKRSETVLIFMFTVCIGVRILGPNRPNPPDAHPYLGAIILVLSLYAVYNAKSNKSQAKSYSLIINSHKKLYQNWRKCKRQY